MEDSDKVYILDSSKISIDRENFPHSFILCCRDVTTANNLISSMEEIFRDEWAWVQLYALHHLYGRNPSGSLRVSYIEYITHIMEDCEHPMILWVGCSPRDFVLFKLKHPICSEQPPISL